MAKIYQRGNQKAQIKVGQTILRTKDTKGVIPLVSFVHCIVCPTSIYAF
jgi:hypothetical protein